MNIVEKRKQQRMAEAQQKTGDESIANGVVSSLVQRYRVIRASVDVDLKAMEGVSSQERRKELKRQHIEKYKEYIDAYLGSEEVHRNSVLTQYMVWLFDVGQIEEGLNLANICIAQDQEMPERFNRSIQGFVADAILEWAQTEVKDSHAVSPYFDQMFDIVTTKQWDIFEGVVCGYYKLAAQMAEDNKEDAKALELYKLADGAWDKAKVTTKINQLTKKLGEPPK